METTQPPMRQLVGTSESPTIRAACDLIVRPDAEAFLRLLNAVYFNQIISRTPACLDQLKHLRDAGLLEQVDPTPRLSREGYLVANVAKEYCHYLDQHRKLEHPDPMNELLSNADVLDLGCSFGRWLWSFQPIARSVLGLELQPEYILLGRALAHREGIPPPDIVNASATDLENVVPERSLDFIFARLVFNYLNIRRTLSACASRLRRGGALWVEVERFSTSFRNIFLAERRARSRLYACFAAMNSVLCSVSGTQLSIRTGGRMHQTHQPAYPTVRWWTNVARRTGFSEVRTIRLDRRMFVFYARKI